MEVTIGEAAGIVVMYGDPGVQQQPLLRAVK